MQNDTKQNQNNMETYDKRNSHISSVMNVDRNYKVHN